MTDDDRAADQPGSDEPDSMPGTPGEGARDEPASSVEHHDSATHMDAHTSVSDDDHRHAEPQLGPIDWGAWSYALLGAAAALVVVALFWVATA